MVLINSKMKLSSKLYERKLKLKGFLCSKNGKGKDDAKFEKYQL